MKTPSSLRCGLLVLVGLCVAFPVFAQDAPAAGPVPQFALIGDVYQKLTESATSWSAPALSSWAFTADLKPKFTYGAVIFQADSSWNFPLTGSLSTPAPPTMSVYEAYFRVTPIESLDLTFGQKRYNIGVGQTFTVGDSINPVIGFFDQKTGFRGGTAEWSPRSWMSVSAALSTDGTNPNAPLGAGQVSFLLDKLQLTSSLVTEQDKTFNPAVGTSYDVLGVILTAEGAAEFLPQGRRPSGSAVWSVPAPWTSPALSGSVGARWTVTLFDIDYTISGEYLHWGQGFTTDETTAWKALSPAARVVSGAALLATHGVRGQENAFLRWSAVSGTEYSATAFAAVDLQDGSVLGQSVVTWTPWDNFDLIGTFQAAWGDPGSSWEFADPYKNKYLASFSTMYHF